MARACVIVASLDEENYSAFHQVCARLLTCVTFIYRAIQILLNVPFTRAVVNIIEARHTIV